MGIRLCKHSKSLQLCLALGKPIDYSLTGFSLQGIHQARILEWVAMPSSRASSQPGDQILASYVHFSGSQILYH